MMRGSRCLGKDSCLLESDDGIFLEGIFYEGEAWRADAEVSGRMLGPKTVGNSFGSC